MELSEPRRRLIFVTFYSFKGGVGRTMALVNAACILAGRGRRVLMIDFDLEAPGLTYLAQRELTRSKKHPDGLVELIQGFLDDPEGSPLTDGKPARFRKQYVQALEVPESLRKLEGGSLELIPCGRVDETYSRRLNQIDFDELYRAGVGLPLFKQLKKVIRESGRYDYVLIDSRTGFSDEAGICTRDLADHNVVLTGLNRQNLNGTADFLRRLKASEWAGRVVFVATPVPTGYEDLRDQRLKLAREAFQEAGFRPDTFLRIPYHPRLALDEDPFFYPWAETDLFASYERIQRELRSMANDTSQVWSNEIVEALQKGSVSDALPFLRELLAESPSTAESLLQFITGPLAASTEGLPERLEPVYAMWLEQDRSPAVCREYGVFLRRQGKLDRAREYLEEALRLAGAQGDEEEKAAGRFDLAYLLIETGEVERAVSEFERVLSYARRSGNAQNIAAALGGLGQALSALATRNSGEVKATLLKTALERCQEAAALNPSDVSLNNWGNALLQLALLEKGLERKRLLQEAGEKYEAALRLNPERDEALSNWGRTLLLLSWELDGAEREECLTRAQELLLRAERVEPGSGAYNLACVTALLGQGPEARKWLETALAHGTCPSRQHLQEDADLASLRDQPWFQEFLTRLPDESGDVGAAPAPVEPARV